MSSQKTYEKVLVERGFISAQQLEKVLHTQSQLGGVLEEVLLSLELLTPAEAKQVQSLVAQIDAPVGGLPKLSSSSAPVSGGLPKLPSSGGGLPKLSSSAPVSGGLPKLPSSGGGLPKLPSVSASDVVAAPVIVEEEKLTTPSGSEHPQLSNPRVHEVMSALERSQFDQSVAETMAPGGPLQDPIKDDTSGGAKSLREAADEQGPSTQPASRQVRMAVPQPRADGICHHCGHKQSAPGKLCEKCHAFLGKSAPNDKLIGLLLDGRFLLNGRLGAGGMGLVYHATDQKTKEFVACKILPIQLSTDEQTIQRFHRIAKLRIENLDLLRREHLVVLEEILELFSNQEFHRQVAADVLFKAVIHVP